MNEEPLEHFKELCAVWIDHLNQIIWRHLYETHHSGFQFAAGSRDAAERTGACHRTGTGVYRRIETGLFL